MKKASFFFTGLLALSMVACKPSDESIQQEVNTKLTSTAPGVNGQVHNGVVTLSGEVVDESSKTDAANAVQDIKGVKSVDNQITIAAPPPPPAPPTTGTDSSVLIAPDVALQKSIDSGFQANGLTGITAAVSNGEVTLTGSVQKASLRKIMQVVHESHPKKVNNQLTLK